MKTSQATNRLVKLGLLTALSILLVFLIHFRSSRRQPIWNTTWRTYPS